MHCTNSPCSVAVKADANHCSNCHAVAKAVRFGPECKLCRIHSWLKNSQQKPMRVKGRRCTNCKVNALQWVTFKAWTELAQQVKELEKHVVPVC